MAEGFNNNEHNLSIREKINTLVSEFNQAVIDKANKASPTFTGTPEAPTAAPGTNTPQLATTAFVKAAIEALIDSAPGALDTLNELAAALGDDPNFATTVTNALAAKITLSSPITGYNASLGGNLSSSDTLIDAISKLNTLINGKIGAAAEFNRDLPINIQVPRTYGTYSSPKTNNTIDIYLANSSNGCKAVLFHQAGAEPTYNITSGGTNVVKKSTNSQAYDSSLVNVITFTHYDNSSGHVLVIDIQKLI